jgi:SAM-dependent methyltransferase
MEFLCCPHCRTDLTLTPLDAAHGEILSGRLACGRCGAAWPIRRGVPDFVSAGAEAIEQTTSGFARNWRSFNEVIRAHESLNDDLLRDWVAPVELAHFDDRVIMDAGCGMGRWASVVSRYRPRALIAFDYSDIAHTEHANLRMLPHVRVLRADLFHPPLQALVDVVYAIGVLHHTPDPGCGFGALARTLAPEGVLVTWTYGAENNEWITRYVDPLRQSVTTRMPHLALLGASQGHRPRPAPRRAGLRAPPRGHAPVLRELRPSPPALPPAAHEAHRLRPPGAAAGGVHPAARGGVLAAAQRHGVSHHGPQRQLVAHDRLAHRSGDRANRRPDGPLTGGATP